jgi:hypothetical protein
MPTTTHPPARQARRAGRSTTPARRGRRPTPHRRGVAGGWLQRGKPEPKSPLKEVLSKLPHRRAAPVPKSRKGKAGGLALLAGAAGLALKNRDKLMAMIKRRGSSDEETARAGGAPVSGTPATGGTEAPLGGTVREAPPTGRDAPPSA